MSEAPTLVLDGIENPGNAEALREVAAMLGWSCVLHDRAGLGGALPTVTLDGLAGFSPLVAVENAPGADDVYGFRLPPGPRPALVVGNERRGISREVLDRAQRTVQIPMASRQLNTINVAAAAAVTLYYLSRGGGGKLHTRADPERHRPELLMIGPMDEIELGSAIRSAAAFGWSRLYLEDRRGVWFETDRVTRSLGRGAARRGRNAIRVIPTAPDRAFAFDEAVVVTAGNGAEPLHRVDLARGPDQLVVVADEGAVDIAAEDLGRLASRVRVVGLDLPSAGHRLRLVASIALAEVARQVGVGKKRPGPGRPRSPAYESAVETLVVEPGGELMLVRDLPW